MPDWLDSEKIDDWTAYSLEWARARYEVREIVPNRCWLVINRKPDSTWIKFAVLDFLRGSSSGQDVKTFLVFHGEGPAGPLRECRHTYWGDDGYLFYPSIVVITAALTALKEFYDL